MTQALCLKCGKFKHGAFDACEACGVCPVDDCDACSLALTDHYFALETYERSAEAFPSAADRVCRQQEERLLATIRDPNLRRVIDIATTMPAPAADAGNKKGSVLGRWF
jgi:hypothetical protein